MFSTSCACVCPYHYTCRAAFEPMTEYDASPDALAEYRTAHQRTLNWVENHDPIQTQFFSPSVPPTVINGTDAPLLPSQAASPAGSAASLPPRMVLKYNDGRADIPISHWHYNNDSHRSSKGRRRHSDTRTHGESRSQHHRRTRSLSSRPDNGT